MLNFPRLTALAGARMRLLCGFLSVGLVSVCRLAAAPPVIFYSDLSSGPNTGGENGNGAWVTIYGSNFGASRGSSVVKTGGGPAAAYATWSETRIAFQLGPAALSGGLSVTTPEGASNEVPFTVRPGHIYFVAPGGSDASAGSFEQPWASLQKALAATAPGDIVYFRDGFRQAGVSTWGASLAIAKSGLPGQPYTLAAYPGALAVIGGDGDYGVRFTASFSHWTFANLSFGAAKYSAFNANGANLRVVGNVFTCPACNSYVPVAGGRSDDSAWLGNEITAGGTSVPAASHLLHSLSVGGNNLEIGWNRIHDNNTCSGVRLHQEKSPGFFNVGIHDNRISDQRCGGIDLSTVDPTQGPVTVFNNLVDHAGLGGYQSGVSYRPYGCLLWRGAGSTTATGEVLIAHNTFYDCAAVLNQYAEPYASAFVFMGSQPSISIRLVNNLTSEPAYQFTSWQNTYISNNSLVGNVSGSNNLWYGDGSGPAYLGANVNADPLLTAPAAGDLHPGAGSPAIGAGVGTPFLRDLEGKPRSTGAFDIGALQAIRAALALASLACVPASLGEGMTAVCTVALTGPAPAPAVTVLLSSNHPSLGVPPSVDVPAGSATASFPATTGAIAADSTVMVLATLGSSQQSFAMLLIAPVRVASLACSPASIPSGGTSACTVGLTKPAASSGTVVSVTSNSALVSVPASVTVPANASSASFSAIAGTSSTTQSVTITASAGGASQNFALTVTPPPPPPPPAGNYYVSTTGSDTQGDGSLTNPWRTIGKAASVAQPGSAIYLRAGIYSENVRINRSGAPGSPITLRSYPGESAVLDGNNQTVLRGIELNGTASDWVVRNLRIQNFKYHAIVGWSRNDRLTLADLLIENNSTGIRLFNSDSTVIRNVTMRNLNAGFNCSPANPSTDPGCTYLTVMDTVAEQTGVAGSTAYDAFGMEKGDHVTFLRCVAGPGVGGDGFDLKATNATLDRVKAFGHRNNLKLWYGTSVVTNSVFYDATADANVTIGNNGGTYTLENNTIANMTAGAYQVRVAYSGTVPTTLVMRNNIISNDNPAQTGTLFYAGPGVSLNISNNLYYNPYRTDAVVCAGGHCYSAAQITGGIWSEPGALYANPGYVNGAAKDFHLAAGSPAVDNGVVTAASPDHDGVPRPQGAAYDRGAYERVP